MHKKLFKYALLGAYLVGVGVIAGLIVTSMRDRKVNPFASASPTTFINPTVTADIGKHFVINFKGLKERFIAFANTYPYKTYLYFNYLNNGSWIGLNERELFTAASTLKVPLAMSVLKAVEDGKITLTDVYPLDELDLDNNFGFLNAAGADQEFSVVELIKIMLEESDNTAMRALSHILVDIGVNSPLGDVYEVMGWELTPVLGEVPNYEKINTKTLSNMFLALYNAKYITVEHSQLILSHLVSASFKDQLSAGVPSDVPVAHKFGVNADTKTFSDCGITYAPGRHYLLCVGIEGGNEATANAFISGVSKAAFDFVMTN